MSALRGRSFTPRKDSAADAAKGEKMTELTKQPGTAPSRQGRPRKLGAGAGKPISFRLAEADHQAYQEKCRAAGLSPSDFFRQCILTNRTEVIAKPQVSKDYGQLLFLYTKASNNINQVALRANSDNRAGKLSESTYEAILNNLETLNLFLKANLKL
jgi:hypothetical protein